MSITRSNATRQFEHVCATAHGLKTDDRLEYSALVDSGDANYTSIRQGSVVSLNSTGKFILGCGAGTGLNYPMPMFSQKNIEDPDVMTGIAGSTYKTTTLSVVGGHINALVATGAFELETTEFDTTASYAPGDVLVPGADTKIGLVVKGTEQAYLNTLPIIGIVAAGKITDKSFNQGRLSFWTCFIPAAHTVPAAAAALSSYATTASLSSYALTADMTTALSGKASSTHIHVVSGVTAGEATATVAGPSEPA